MSSLLPFIALLGGIVPALVWLCFWLLEDRCEPEPKRYLLLTFLFGMLAVPLVLPVERYFIPYLAGPSLLLVWAVAEELIKFGAAYIAALHWHVFDEPLDAVVYMVTAALGFSAAENALFLITPLTQGDLLHTIVTGDLRFMGAMLLHVLSSATIGIAMAASFYKGAGVRRFATLGGVVLAITLHTLFNFFILREGGSAIFAMFLSIWIGIVILLALVESIKQPSRDYC